MILGKKIEGFAYAERHCTYCERLMHIQKVAHLQDEPEHYKALFYCLNDECGAYDEDARKCYALVYYSSQESFDALYMQRIWVTERPEK